MRNAFVLVALCFAVESLAATSIQDFPTHRKATWFEPYIMGVGAGLLWANTSLRHDGKTPLYCPPDKRGVSFNQYMAILNRELALPDMRAVDPRTPIELVLLSGLRHTFPCSGTWEANRCNLRIVPKRSSA